MTTGNEQQVHDDDVAKELMTVDLRILARIQKLYSHMHDLDSDDVDGDGAQEIRDVLAKDIGELSKLVTKFGRAHELRKRAGEPVLFQIVDPQTVIAPESEGE